MSNQEPLRDTLRAQADRVGGTSPLTLDDVKGRARGIRRRRMAVSGLAAGAVLAIAVPAGIAVSNQVGGRPDRGPAAGPSVTPTPGTSPTPDGSPTPTQSDPLPVTLTTAVEAGSYEPGIPYLFDGAVVRPDGSEVTMPATYSELAPLGDGWAAVRNDGGSQVVDFLDADGKPTAQQAIAGSLAVSADGTVVAFATPDGEVMTAIPNSEPMQFLDPRAVPDGELDAVAVIGSDSCMENSAGGGCAVFLNAQDAGGRAGYSTTSHGIVAPLSGLLDVAGLSPDGSLSGMVSASDSGSCSVVLGRSWDVAWKTCDYTLGQFSPDGRYVIGYAAYRDGIGDSSVAILDARTGEPLARFVNSEEHPSFIHQVVWDEDDTLLATVFEGSWSLMRMTADGELSRVANLAGGSSDEVPLVLSTRP